MKEFKTAIRQESAEGDGDSPEKSWPFVLDGVEYRIFQPTPEQYAVFVASTGRRTDEREQIAGVVDLFFNMLDDRSNARLYERLVDRRDPFDAKMIEEIIEWMVEEWSGKASEKSSGSTGSQPSTGTSSSPPIPVST